MARGIDATDLFLDDEDRHAFLNLVGSAVVRADLRCYAWALMRNHYHLVLRTSDQPLARAMKPLNSRYAGYFNKRHSRRGYLFQDRFKSLASQDQRYIEEMVRYVHLNPLRAGICRDLESLDAYPWCGHSALMGTHRREFQDTRTILMRFGKDTESGRREYRRFIEAGVGNEDDSAMNVIRTATHGGQSRTDPARWVIGDPEFVRNTMSNDRERRTRIARYAAEGWDVSRLCAVVADRLNTSPELLVRRSRGPGSNGRKILAYLATRELDLPATAIARFFGISGSAVSKMIPCGERLAKESGITLKISQAPSPVQEAMR